MNLVFPRFEILSLFLSESLSAAGELVFPCMRLLQPAELRTTPANILDALGRFHKLLPNMLLSEGLGLLIYVIGLWASIQALTLTFDSHRCLEMAHLFP